MIEVVASTFSKWKKHPKRWDVFFLLGTALRSYRRIIDARRLAVVTGRRPIDNARLYVPAIDPTDVPILSDPDFRRSVKEVKDHTLLDFARLANIWTLARLTGPGAFLEVGSYRGGGVLHICNAIASRNAPFYCFDPFESGGFEHMSECDTLCQKDDFLKTDHLAVKTLLSNKPNAQVIKGYFPAAAENLDIREIAFCHLDVDAYHATRTSLAYLADRLAPRSLIVLDDVNCGYDGVDKALAEFLGCHPSFLLIPIFSSQAVLLSKSLW